MSCLSDRGENIALESKVFNQSLVGCDLLSMRDLSKETIEMILECAQGFKRNPRQRLLEGYLMASCFFEPSTRTRLSFEAAMKLLGGDVIGFSESATTSIKKGESLHDSMRVIGKYVDVVVLRHPLDGAAKAAAISCEKPVINAGDGANEHPTQTLLDLFSIKECKGRLDSLNIILAGDLKYGRTAHSLALAFRNFQSRLFFVSPKSCVMPDEVCEDLRRNGIQFSFHTQLEEVIEKADILYMTRIQEERFTDRLEFERVSSAYNINLESLENAKEDLKIFHPLPRINEISPEIDQTPFSYYFIQAENGLYVRQAILTSILGR